MQSSYKTRQISVYKQICFSIQKSFVLLQPTIVEFLIVQSIFYKAFLLNSDLFVYLVGIENKMELLKTMFVLVLSMCCILFETVHAEDDQHPSILVGLLIGLPMLAIENAGKCSYTAGCYKGSCWAYCGISLSSGDWCYTTKTYSQSYAYVSCKHDDECNKCWKCAGPCTVFG